MITVYGSSDDLIEIEGDIVEEFGGPWDEETYLGFSDGTLLSIEYTDSGIWRINRLKEGSASYSKVEGTSSDDDYTDKVTLAENGLSKISWVVQGNLVQASRKGK